MITGCLNCLSVTLAFETVLKYRILKQMINIENVAMGRPHSGKNGRPPQTPRDGHLPDGPPTSSRLQGVVMDAGGIGPVTLEINWGGLTFSSGQQQADMMTMMKHGKNFYLFKL